MQTPSATTASLLGAAATAWRRGAPVVDQETKALNWPAIYTIAETVLDRARYFYFLDSDARARATLILMSVTSSIREYAIVEALDIAPAWNELRAEVKLVDLLMAITADLLLETGVSIATLATALAAAIHSVIPRSAKGEPETEGTVYDIAFLESVGTAEELANILTLHPWLLMLLILKRSGRMNLVRPQVEKPVEASA